MRSCHQRSSRPQLSDLAHTTAVSRMWALPTAVLGPGQAGGGRWGDRAGGCVPRVRSLLTVAWSHRCTTSTLRCSGGQVVQPDDRRTVGSLHDLDRLGPGPGHVLRSAGPPRRCPRRHWRPGRASSRSCARRGPRSSVQHRGGGRHRWGSVLRAGDPTGLRGRDRWARATRPPIGGRDAAEAGVRPFVSLLRA